MVFSQTHCHLHPKLNGVLEGITEAAWGVVRLQRDLSLSFSCLLDQEDAWGTGSSTILGRGSWHFGNGWGLAECERWRGSGLAASWAAGGAGFSSCWVGAILGRLEAATELECLGRKCRIAKDDFWAAVKRSAMCKTKQAGGGDQGVEEGDFICLLDLHKVQPHVALKHHQTGHGPANCLSRGVQSQVGRTVKLFEGCRVWARLVHGAE